MIFNPIEHVDEFLGSDFYRVAALPAQEHAQAILGAFFSGLQTQDGLTIDKHEAALHTLLRLDLPVEARREAPAIIRSFYQFVYTTGRYPDAAQWERDLDIIEARYRSRIRDDGTVRGETHSKKYTDVGRNDPCPCGSGKKFKKCCMGRIDV